MVSREEILQKNELDEKSILEFQKKIVRDNGGDDLSKEKELYRLLKRAKGGKTDLLKIEDLILHGVDVNYQNQENSKSKNRPKGYSLLFLAASKGVFDACVLLLRAGAIVDLNTTYGSTALMRAARNGHNDIVKLLLAMNANIDHINNYGSTSLMWAARKGHLDVVETLIDNGANINLCAIDGDTALISAARHNRKEIVMKLITSGASINAVNMLGETALTVTTDTNIQNIFKNSGVYLSTDKDVDTQIAESFEELVDLSLNILEETKVKIKK